MKLRIDSLGRILIPKIIRESLGIKAYDDLEIEIIDDKIIIKKTSK